MNYPKILFTVLAVFSLAFLGSCHKHDSATDVTIEFESPTEGLILISGDTLDIHIHYTADAMIHNVEVKVINETNNNEVVFSFDEHVHADGSYAFEDKVPLTVTENSIFRIETMVTGHDSEDDTFSKSVHFEVHKP